jgi:phosphoglycolate phosphatase-like HAD superfamily hydrolase
MITKSIRSVLYLATSLPYHKRFSSMAGSKPVTLIAFDVDGTLVRKTAATGKADPHARAFMHAVGKHYATDSDFMSKYTSPIDFIPENKYHGNTDGLILLNTLKYAFDIPCTQSAAALPELFSTMYQYFASLPDDEISAGIAPIPGVISTLSNLARMQQTGDHVLCGLVTGNVEGIARKKMRACGIYSTGVLGLKATDQGFDGENDHAFLGGFGSDYCSGDLDDPTRPVKDRGEQIVIAYRRALTLLRGDQKLVRVVHVGDAPADVLAAKWCYEEGKFGPDVAVGCVGVGTGTYSTAHLLELVGESIPGKWEPVVLDKGVADEGFIEACGVVEP